LNILKKELGRLRLRVYDLIVKKRDGKELTKEEIEYLVKEYIEDKVPDYQMAALLMAIYFQGMTFQETKYLTRAMIESGKVIDLSSIPGIKVDKHSTGGVGDTTTLVLAPLVSSAGVPVAKMSGRGLGHTGGTIDKLESIEGFRTELNIEEFIKIVKKIGLAVISSGSNLVPADKKFYALRDVTGTLNSIPLIVSSIMSKKIAAGADAIVLEVTTGSGAFMNKYKDALTLAKIMVDIGREFKKEVVAVITNMDEPLGFAIGNSLEVKEAIEVLKNEGPNDLRELCLELGSYMLKLSGVVNTNQEGKNKLIKNLREGKALEKFKEMIIAQGGNAQIIENLNLLPLAKNCITIKAKEAGYVQRINARLIGEGAMILGAGRERKDSRIDLSVGIVLKKKIGDQVKVNDDLMEIHYNEIKKLDEARERVTSAFRIGKKKPLKIPLILAVIDKEGLREYN